jgi:hypothetical protein
VTPTRRDPNDNFQHPDDEGELGIVVLPPKDGVVGPTGVGTVDHRLVEAVGATEIMTPRTVKDLANPPGESATVMLMAPITVDRNRYGVILNELVAICAQHGAKLGTVLVKGLDDHTEVIN